MTRVVIYERGIQDLFRNPQKRVAQIVNGRAERIRANAESNINRNMDSRTGDLLASLRKIPLQGDVYHVVVGADAHHRGFPYAKALETGINPLTGADMKFNYDYSYMVPAVRQSGFRPR